MFWLWIDSDCSCYVTCCILLYPVVSCCRYDFIAFGFGHDKLGSALWLFGSSAQLQLERWSFGCRRCIWCISLVIFVIFVIFVFCFRFFWNCDLAHSHIVASVLFCTSLFSISWDPLLFWHRFLKIISLISVSRLLQVSYLPGYGLWCKPWYCAALSSRNTFESNCFNICKLYIYIIIYIIYICFFI